MLRLATLLEGVGCVLFFLQVEYSNSFIFGGKNAVKLEIEVNIKSLVFSGCHAAAG